MKHFLVCLAVLLLLTIQRSACSAAAIHNMKRNDKVSMPNKSAHSFTVGKNTFLLDGKPFVVKAAEVHYPRIPRPYWEHRIQMCKALGMNTLCIYAFWNIHEQREGVFNFTGNNDVAEFCRLAQKHGMYVIVRPGPYACAEWEMGGLPWWLLKKKDIRLREPDLYFMSCAARFEQRLAEQLSPLAIQQGGPIIMVQVENEYGSYGEDKQYMASMRDIIRKAWGDDMVLFQCDWSSNFWKNGLEDLVWTMNFGTGANIAEQFQKLKEMRPEAPLMCSEFWSGWFDKWGARHETRPADDMVAGIDEMLSQGISFSLYMTHGGTSFGHWAGANSPGFAPDVTSYDYDAPINEYGQPTKKYWRLREVLQRYSKEKLPAVPKSPTPIISVPAFKMSRVMDINHLVTATRESRELLTMEDLDTGWGMIEYTTTLPEVDVESVLTLDECHDFAQIFIDGNYVGTIDRAKHERKMMIPPVKKGSVLTILVEAMGRINFGRAINDRKGITKAVTLQAETDNHEVTWNLKDWKIRAIADDYAAIRKAIDERPVLSSEPAVIQSNGGYFMGRFVLKKVGDTFLNMESFGKGQVWVNGHAIGRYWNIGPQQTLYVPGCWLRRGSNEVLVLDVVGPKGEPTAFCQDQPQLDQLRLEKPRLHNDLADKPNLELLVPLQETKFATGNGWQRIYFTKQASGRHFALQALAGHDGKDRIALAEIYLLDAHGKRISREPWTVKYADSEETVRGNNTADKAFDLQESTYWRTVKGTPLPHLLVIDLGEEQTLSGFEYLPRAEEGAPESISHCRVYVY